MLIEFLTKPFEPFLRTKSIQSIVRADCHYPCLLLSGEMNYRGPGCLTTESGPRVDWGRLTFSHRGKEPWSRPRRGPGLSQWLHQPCLDADTDRVSVRSPTSRRQSLLLQIATCRYCLPIRDLEWAFFFLSRGEYRVTTPVLSRRSSCWSSNSFHTWAADLTDHNGHVEYLTVGENPLFIRFFFYFPDFPDTSATLQMIFDSHTVV